MRVFHGSNVKIEEIDLSKSEHYKDFGRGFYVTKIKKHAMERAKTSVKIRGKGKPIVTEFNYFEHYPATIGLSVKKFDNVSEEWVKFIMMNRNMNIAQPSHNFDIVEGPIADDKMILQIQKYELGYISIKELIKRLTYKEPTHQICFCTQKSLYALELAEDKKFQFALDEISSKIIESIIRDKGCSMQNATDIFLMSSTYEKLSTEDTLLWKKSWQEIYGILKKELSSH